MKRYSCTIRTASLCVLLALSAACLSACNGAGDVSSNESVASSDYALAAGAQSAALGVNHWNLDNAGIVRAVGSDGKVVAELQILAKHEGIVNVANKSSKILFDETGAVKVDTMSDADRKLTEGLRSDLLAASQAVAESSDAAGAQKALEWVAFACCNGGYAGVLYQWWYNGWTPYCAFRQQSGYCSGLWDCGTLAANRGCQYWY